MRTGFMLVVTGMVAISAVGDWAQWRGPRRDGVSEESVALKAPLDAAALSPLWTSAPILGDADGGFGSPVVAGDRVFLYCSWRTHYPIASRKLGADDARPLGLPPKGAAADLVARVDAARGSLPVGVSRDVRQAAARQWIEGNLTADERKALGPFAEDRLMRGTDALPLEVMDKIASILGQTFPDQAALDGWFATNGIAGEVRSRIDRAVPKETNAVQDVFFALGAGDGKTLWRTERPGRAGVWGSSSTPLAVGDRVYCGGSAGNVYALDAATGDVKWTRSLGGGEVNSSFAFADGRLFVLARRLVALDADTGAILWEQPKATGGDSSPVLVTLDGKSFVFAGAGELACVDPADGRVAWTVKGGGHSTPAVAGGVLALCRSNTGLSLYRVSAQAAVPIAELKAAASRGGSALNDGEHVFVLGRDESVCVKAADGQSVWKAEGIKDDFSSPVLADGKLIAVSGKGDLAMFDAATGGPLGRARVGALRCTSPALSAGRLFVRTEKGVACYDLRR